MANETQSDTLNHNEQSEEQENQLIANRRNKLHAIKKKGIAYPNHFKKDAFADELQKKFFNTSKEALELESYTASIAGRIMLNRGAFLEIQDMSGRIQIYINRKVLSPIILAEIKTWDLGDIIGATGTVQRSNKGDLYLNLSETILLSKCLRPLPEKHKGLADIEQRYRQRYVDLIMNQETRQIFSIRAQTISCIRQFLEDRQFIEVETPMLHSIPGGTNAVPFTTHHNALGMDMFLRIAPELYLKRLTIGGLERVYEINRNFRNEGLSTRHNPEFTMLEFYWAYATYIDQMNITEELLRTLALQLLDTLKFPYDEYELDFSRPFDRLTPLEALKKYTDYTNSQLTQQSELTLLCQSLSIDVQKTDGLGKLQMALFDKTTEHCLIQPTFIINHPTETSPLARACDDNPDITERWELYIASREIANAYSELNDPEEQAKRFQHQAKAKKQGDNEAMYYDADYIKAMEYGLPPTAGNGIGIDRLVMLFTNTQSIRDVLLFPHMRPE
ncbi:MAG: lysine--tRNA ligase [Endozoicomonadaceae bacterium]|nr:lysine--tRNA ligase [Endozoicomonadaceae bacterium]